LVALLPQVLQSITNCGLSTAIPAASTHQFPCKTQPVSVRKLLTGFEPIERGFFLHQHLTEFFS